MVRDVGPLTLFGRRHPTVRAHPDATHLEVETPLELTDRERVLAFGERDAHALCPVAPNCRQPATGPRASSECNAEHAAEAQSCGGHWWDSRMAKRWWL